MAFQGAAIARQIADEYTAQTPEKPRFVAGAIGPLTKSLTVGTNSNDPGHRDITYDDVYQSYYDQAMALHEGGVDFILFETIMDTLNAKAGIKAILDLEDKVGPLPIWLSVSINSANGRVQLSSQTLDAFCISVKHARPF